MAKKKVKIRRRHLERCGLCGKMGRLTKTECCDQWICDDEDQYKLFSFERNSCSRNHRRYTLCGFHHVEGHEGDWKTCEKCKENFESDIEMYVDAGTNEYNFEKLPDPPSYEPSFCSECGKIIVKADGGYSQLGDKITCMKCNPIDLSRFQGTDE